jgi:integrase
VFCRDDGSPYTASMVKRWSADACKRAGLARATLHGLRHSYGSALGNTGGGRDVVRVLLGHSSDAMAARYTHLSEGYMREAVERLVEVRGRVGASAIIEQPSDEKAR